MEETKYGKYIVTELKRNLVRPAWNKAEKNPKESVTVLQLDSSIVEGAFHVGGSWFWPREFPPVPLAERPNPVLPHSHDFDEVLALFGTNRDDPHDLCGELEVWLDGEKHLVTKSCIIFIPRGLVHGPIGWNRIDRPIFHFGCGTSGMYTGKM